MQARSIQAPVRDGQIGERDMRRDTAPLPPDGGGPPGAERRIPYAGPLSPRALAVGAAKWSGQTMHPGPVATPPREAHRV